MDVMLGHQRQQVLQRSRGNDRTLRFEAVLVVQLAAAYAHTRVISVGADTRSVAQVYRTDHCVRACREPFHEAIVLRHCSVGEVVLPPRLLSVDKGEAPTILGHGVQGFQVTIGATVGVVDVPRAQGDSRQTKLWAASLCRWLGSQLEITRSHG